MVRAGLQPVAGINPLCVGRLGGREPCGVDGVYALFGVGLQNATQVAHFGLRESQTHNPAISNNAIFFSLGSL